MAVASLQMLPYTFTFTAVRFRCFTYREYARYRKHAKGIMHQLLLRSFEVAREREFPLMLLVPQEEWLLGFYAKYGFAQTFDAGVEQMLLLKKVLDLHPYFAGSLPCLIPIFEGVR